jgi:exonuclease III
MIIEKDEISSINEESFAEYLNQFLSDHTVQLMHFTFTIKPTFFFSQGSSFTLYGATWNMQKICFSNKEEKRSNNPFGLNETWEDYEKRLMRQLNKIEEIVTKPKNKKDFMCLQETDFLSKKVKLKAKFEKMLERNDWGLVCAPESENGHQCRSVALIYNKKTLAPKEGIGRALFLYTRGKFTDYYAYEWEFIHLPTQQKLALVSMHLAYTAEYNEIIPHYLKEQESKKIPTILAGDTNHVAREIPGALVGKQSYCTNINQNEENGSLKLKENNEDQHYDVFIASHLGQSSPITITPSEPYGEKFVQKNNKYFLVPVGTRDKVSKKDEFLAELEQYAYAKGPDNKDNEKLQSWYSHIKASFHGSMIGFYCIQHAISGIEAGKALEQMTLSDYFTIFNNNDKRKEGGLQYGWVGFKPGDINNDEVLKQRLLTDFKTKLDATMVPTSQYRF